MRVAFTLFVVAMIAAAGYFIVKSDPQSSVNSNNLPSTTRNKTIQPVTITDEAAFVPYWATMSELSTAEEDRLFYFGVSVDENGIQEADPGYKNMSTFVNAKGSKKAYLTVRMLDTDTNSTILKDKSSWNIIALDISTAATQNGFDGVVLDLEVGLAAFSTDPNSITEFNKTLADSAHSYGLQYATTIYGDTYYRGRPYNVKDIGDIADELVIMAYDFHKSFGTPGPNFPLKGRDEYGYDFETMIHDFTQQVEPDKLTITFGMFGYQWNVDNEDRPLKSATAITLNQIRAKYVPTCSETNCKVTEDATSGEKNITFGSGERHTVIWFEDGDSVAKKKALLEQSGIGSVGYWAYGYY